MNEIEKAIQHLTMLRRLDSGEKKPLYDLAIQALEKQTPKKSDKEDEKDMKCPICGTWSSKIFEHQYCSYCGQRIVNSTIAK
jgi:hypothetical protein